MSQQPQVIYLKDYSVPAFLIRQTALRFELGSDSTLVKSSLQLQRNPEAADQAAALALHGDKELVLHRVAINGEVLAESDYQRDDSHLILSNLPGECELEIVTEIYPDKNTALEGLYRSDGMYCTQCEAEGFRRITFYLDRPDVMSVFSTTIVADLQSYPVLLSNGNLTEQGEEDDGRHWVTWEDPHPKPAYLFALVAGNLEKIEDTFTTRSEREVKLEIYAAEKDLDKLDYAMSSLKSSMRWDEEVYGREYDLDVFMIVAVDFFNMGAMENKGLNIFNTSCVLAHPNTTTDAGFGRVEAVVAHEYFHNWSGNRVTCRDWFQLSLKEGFTVFRDAQFSADMNSPTVKRIEDVQLLRTAQFSEDAGPTAHPVRPASFIEISNFYTMTVYEKGAEVVRMIHRLLGAELFRQGSDLYFERHDGQAVTTDDFVAAMAEVSGRDLSQFKRWYSQAGTPVLTVSDEYDADTQVYRLKIVQQCPATPGQQEKLPFHMPIAVGLLDAEGNDYPLESGQSTQILELTEQEQVFEFSGIAARPVPSLLRDFSAPVKLNYPYSREQLVFLMSNDSDGFNRWEASEKLAASILLSLVEDIQAGRELQLDECLTEAYRAVLGGSDLDKAMVAKVLSLPSESYLAELSEVVDVDAIHQAREFAKRQLAEQLQIEFLAAYQGASMANGNYSPDAESVARRMLQNLCLSYLCSLERDAYYDLAGNQFEQADNMTERLAALSLLAQGADSERAEAALESFYQQFQDEALVVNQWLAVQAGDPREGTLQRVQQLLQHEAFDMRNPNKVRSLIGAFCGQNPVNFHALDASGYRFLAEQVIALNNSNPQIAARLVAPLTKWRRYSEQRQLLMREQLERIMASGELSRDVYEVVSKGLAQ